MYYIFLLKLFLVKHKWKLYLEEIGRVKNPPSIPKITTYLMSTTLLELNFWVVSYKGTEFSNFPPKIEINHF